MEGTSRSLAPRDDGYVTAIRRRFDAPQRAESDLPLRVTRQLPTSPADTAANNTTNIVGSYPSLHQQHQQQLLNQQQQHQHLNQQQQHQQQHQLLNQQQHQLQQQRQQPRTPTNQQENHLRNNQRTPIENRRTTSNNVLLDDERCDSDGGANYRRRKEHTQDNHHPHYEHRQRLLTVAAYAAPYSNHRRTGGLTCNDNSSSSISSTTSGQLLPVPPDGIRKRSTLSPGHRDQLLEARRKQRLLVLRMFVEEENEADDMHGRRRVAEIANQRGLSPRRRRGRNTRSTDDDDDDDDDGDDRDIAPSSPSSASYRWTTDTAATATQYDHRQQQQRVVNRHRLGVDRERRQAGSEGDAPAASLLPPHESTAFSCGVVPSVDAATPPRAHQFAQHSRSHTGLVSGGSNGGGANAIIPRANQRRLLYHHHQPNYDDGNSSAPVSPRSCWSSASLSDAAQSAQNRSTSRRQLPTTPDQQLNIIMNRDQLDVRPAPRRSSSPRLLPTPPPEQQQPSHKCNNRPSSPELRPPSPSYYEKGRRGSGRLLPKTPEELQQMQALQQGGTASPARSPSPAMRYQPDNFLPRANQPQHHQYNQLDNQPHYQQQQQQQPPVHQQHHPKHPVEGAKVKTRTPSPVIRYHAPAEEERHQPAPYQPAPFQHQEPPILAHHHNHPAVRSVVSSAVVRENTLEDLVGAMDVGSTPPPTFETPSRKSRRAELSHYNGSVDSGADSGVSWSVAQYCAGPLRKRSMEVTPQTHPRGGSFDHSVGTPSTNPEESQGSSLSPSMEQLSKSSSDMEDPAALGLDPSLYGGQSGAVTSSGSIPEHLSSSTAPVDHGGGGETDLPRPTGLGLLHYSLQHFPVRRRLRVNIIKAEGLAGQLRPELELHAFCKVCLMPGKLGKQQSRIVKRTRDAVFCEEFFFDHVGPEDLALKSLLIRVCHHSNKQFNKDIVIGDIDVPLKHVPELHNKKEVKLVEELHPKILKKLGKLHIGLLLERESKRLTINVTKAEDLPKWGISGPPDPCVRITLTQKGKSQIKQTRTLKNTCNAVYREYVMFLVSVKTADLADTSVMVSVHDTARTACGDDLVGSAYLGTTARDKSETEQWRNAIEHPGKEFRAVHNLKMPSNQHNPAVHVSETHSDLDEAEE